MKIKKERLNVFIICRFYMIGISLTKLITGVIGIFTFGYYIPKFELYLAKKYAQWNFKRKENDKN